MPAKVRQTANTKKAASVFGVAVKSAARLRRMLRPILPNPADREMMYELDNAFRKWLHTKPLERQHTEDGLPYFQWFSFNKKAVLGKVFRRVMITREGDNNLVVTIPSFNPLKDVTAPRGTASAGLRLMAVALPLDNPEGAFELQTNISLPYDNLVLPQQEVMLEGLTGPKTLVTISVALYFYRSPDESLPIQQMRWLPAGITGSFYN